VRRSAVTTFVSNIDGGNIAGYYVLRKVSSQSLFGRHVTMTIGVVGSRTIGRPLECAAAVK
jgi:hypothetical protein